MMTDVAPHDSHEKSKPFVNGHKMEKKKKEKTKKQPLIFKLVSYLPTFCAWISLDIYDEQLML